MAHNNVSVPFFQRQILCLNALRETQWINTVTNETVLYITNRTVTALTNRTASTSVNAQVSSVTNQMPGTFSGPVPSNPGLDGAAEEATATNEAPSASRSSGVPTMDAWTTATTTNTSTARAPLQKVTAGSIVTVTARNNQATIATNHQSITLGTNLTTTMETNFTITLLTNVTVTPYTNVSVIITNLPRYYYYLYTELTPPDFVVENGESLVVLADGRRFAFATSKCRTAFNTRNNFSMAFFQVPGEALVAIGNAREVKLRLRGVSSVIEKKLSWYCRKHFRKFIARYCVAESLDISEMTSTENEVQPRS